jgi:hypothetical protein
LPGLIEKVLNGHLLFCGVKLYYALALSTIGGGLQK